MKEELDDRDLRDRFHRLHEEIDASTPPFAVRPPHTIKRLPILWTLASVGAAAVLVVVLWSAVIQNGRTTVSGIDLNVVAWTAPSDYLLETPGRELLRTIPVFDVTDYAVSSSDLSSGAADTSS